MPVSSWASATYQYPEADILGAAMDWSLMREAYRRELKAATKTRGLNQQKVAAAGGLTGQNVVSKLLRNKNLGPAVEIFTKAVEGLGMPCSEFFARIERRVR